MDSYRVIGEYPPTFRLCLVKGDTAYFACGNPREVRGDDWNDAPAGSNAGEPCLISYFTVKLGEGLFCPDHYSANDYNALVAPWVIKSSLDAKWQDVPVAVEIYAGIEFGDFVELCAAIGSPVYLPVK